jgi:hypothetical protein
MYVAQGSQNSVRNILEFREYFSSEKQIFRLCVSELGVMTHEV